MCLYIVYKELKHAGSSDFYFQDVQSCAVFVLILPLGFLFSDAFSLSALEIPSLRHSKSFSLRFPVCAV